MAAGSRIVEIKALDPEDYHKVTSTLQVREIQATIALPGLSGRGELNAPFLPVKRLRQILSTVSRIPGIDLGDRDSLYQAMERSE